MTPDYGRRWRDLWAWLDAFPLDDQERLLGQMEREDGPREGLQL